MRRLLSALLITGLAASSSGCWFKKKYITVPMGEHKGGQIAVASCAYTVTLREGASAPYGGQPLLGENPAPFFVHLGLAGDPSTSVVMQWRTDFETLVSTVELTESGGTPVTHEGFTFDYESLDATTIRMHETHICGLKPDTEYTYRVGGKDEIGAASWSKSYTFRTAPAPTQTDAELVVLVLGDTRDGYVTWKDSLDRAFAIERPDLLLFSGDAITFGPYQMEWESWFMATGDYLAEVPFLSAHGNHDLNSINYFAQFAMPGDEENFGLDFGPLHLTVLNDSPVDKAVLTGSTAQFLQNDLSTSVSRPWRFMLHHRPIWSASTGHGGDIALKDAWQSIIDQYRPDLVLNGHDHDYERTKPLRNSQPQATANEGTTYIVAGSSGAPLYDAAADFWTEYSEKTNSFVLIKIRDKQLNATAYRPADGSVLDSFSITKP